MEQSEQGEQGHPAKSHIDSPIQGCHTIQVQNYVHVD